MKDLNDFTKTSEIMDKYGAFFAFSNEQFNEKKEEGVKYYRDGSGMIYPQENAKALKKELNEDWDRAEKEYLATYTKTEIIHYELRNHEAGYTMDWTDTYEAVSHLGITKEEVEKEFPIWCKIQQEWEESQM